MWAQQGRYALIRTNLFIVIVQCPVDQMDRSILYLHLQHSLGEGKEAGSHQCQVNFIGPFPSRKRWHFVL